MTVYLSFMAADPITALLVCQDFSFHNHKREPHSGTRGKFSKISRIHSMSVPNLNKLYFSPDRPTLSSNHVASEATNW